MAVSVRRVLATALSAAVAAVVVAQSGPADARASDLAVFEDPAASESALRRSLDGDAAALARSPWSSAFGDVTVCSRSDEEARKSFAADVDGAVARVRDALRAAGWSVPTNPQRLVVVHVRVTGAPSAIVESTDGRAFALRAGDSVRRVDPPTVPARPDGPPLERDMVAAAGRARVWAWTTGADTSPPTAGAVAARAGLRSVALPAETPQWVREGLAAWLTSKATRDPPPAPAHVCGTWSAPSAAAVERIAAAGASAPASARPFLGRFVGGLVADRKDGATKLLTLAAEPGTLDARLAKHFGTTLSAAVAAAAGPAVAAGAAPSCGEEGTVACPACAGGGKLDVACDNCGGTGAVTCPSCLADSGCPNCERGWVYYESGGRAKCRYCSGGKTRCLACSNQARSQCRVCRGSGKTSRACLACTGGKLPCPAGGTTVSAPPCPWCADAKLIAACGNCTGVGYLGCRNCWGTERRVCSRCLGTGDRRMVYEDGTTASISKCDICTGKGFVKCDECKAGKEACTSCAGKGLGERDHAKCVACRGSGSLRPVGFDLLRTPSEPLTSDETDAQEKMVESAVAFLLKCRAGSGAFALRDLRRGKTTTAGALREPTPFSNAMALWTLAVAGRGKDDPVLAPAWTVLRADAQRLVAERTDYVGTQATGLTLRALVMGGEDPAGPLVKGLVDRLARAQQADGLWGADLNDPKAETELLDSLFAAESLRTVRIKGAKVPSAVWQKLYRGATSELETKLLTPKAEFVIGTHVASATAMVVMAKEGSLGKAATAFDYASIPAVRRGMAWLDRHFDIEREPQFSKDARRPSRGDSGYMAWLFSIQRLGMLLNTEELGGERWFTTGVRHLRSVQYADGSFEERNSAARNGPLRTTTGAILFLLRATPPITNSDDE